MHRRSADASKEDQETKPHDCCRLRSLRFIGEFVGRFLSSNIDEEYDRLVEHLHDGDRKAERTIDVEKRLSSKSLELIRQRGIARDPGDYQLMYEPAKLCREAMK
uniref:CARD domain-containing protein n=1 Tax=Haemonchus contortus TaxID=6289 RepID=A0A7I4Z562_HAECO